jgi:hypothetical protein
MNAQRIKLTAVPLTLAAGGPSTTFNPNLSEKEKRR